MQELSASYLLCVAAVAVVLLLFMIMKLKIHAFISLIIISFLTSLAANTPLDKILGVMLGGFGSTLASVALLVGIGAMIGKILEVSGGAQVLADTLIEFFGVQRAPFALGLASLIFAFPIFFDAGLIVMLPVILSVAHKLKGSVLTYALPSVGAFSVMHVFLPPHPGPVAAAATIDANVGWVLILGLIIGLPTWYFSSYLFGLYSGKKMYFKAPDLFEDEKIEIKHKPKFLTVLFILLTPVVLIFISAIISSMQKLEIIAKNDICFNILNLIGQTPIALMITLIICIIVFNKSLGAKNLEKYCEKALPAICSVVLVTGAGGMFGGVLRASGIGDALAGTLANLGVPVILAGFIIAAIIRIAQGSATVALTTTAGLMAPIIAANTSIAEFDKVAIVLAIACGSVVCSHFNDSGFWLVKGLFGLDEKTTLKTWTILETLIGVIGFVLILIILALFNLVF